MQACTRFRKLAPYNAMLVEMQRPGAKYVQTERQWREIYGRVIKPNARPLVILVPFGPVEFVFDIGDTICYPGGLFKRTDEDILDEIAAPFRTKQPIRKQCLDSLIGNLVFHGIQFDRGFVSGAGYGARIELRNDLDYIDVPINSKMSVTWKADYLLSVSKDAKDGECFASICHELAHLLCHHLIMPTSWKEKAWITRNIAHDLEEFEAESVSWLVCERLGIGNMSEKYLASYFSDDATISQDISMEHILAATNTIEQMLKPATYKQGLLFKHSQSFKQAVLQKKGKP